MTNQNPNDTYFTDDDERGFTLLPVGYHPAEVDKWYKADAPDKHGNTFYKIELHIISKDYTGVPVTASYISAFEMKHLLIHLMRSVGMMHDMIVDPMFRKNPANSTSFDIIKVLLNLPGCKVLLDIIHNTDQKKGKTYHNITDFLPLKKKDGTAVAQPIFRDIPTSAPPTGDGTDLDPDLNLEEDDYYAN